MVNGIKEVVCEVRRVERALSLLGNGVVKDYYVRCFVGNINLFVGFAVDGPD